MKTGRTLALKTQMVFSNLVSALFVQKYMLPHWWNEMI